MTEALLEAKSISKKYEDRYVLQNTDLKIDHQMYESLPICSKGTYPLGVGITTSFTLAKSLRLFGSRRN